VGGVSDAEFVHNHKTMWRRHVASGSETPPTDLLGKAGGNEAVMQEIIDALAAEFSDLGDAGQAATVTFRLLLAAVLGGALGFERESAGKAAGMRTHMLVGIGAAMFLMAVNLAGGGDAESSRIIQGVVAGIGFLGAGAIVKGKAGEEIHGLTTAASIWMTAAIGVTVGLGHASTAILSTGLALVVLAALQRWCGGLHPNGHGHVRGSHRGDAELRKDSED
jgi:putative Mg2+ transporter-C (MgtC) family protein